MDWKIISLRERRDMNRDKGFVRYKLARFSVNGAEHTIKISMPDFDAGKTQDIVAKEAQKIIQALTKKK